MDEHVRGTNGNREKTAKRHPRISIQWKLFAYLALFTTFILIVVWVFQIGLLNYFYRQSKYNEMLRTVDAMEASLTHGEVNINEIRTIAKDYAEEYTICVRVFELYWIGDKGYANELASADVARDCLIHNVSDRTLGYLYRQASENGGLYTMSVSPEEVGSAPFDPEKPWNKGGFWRRITGGENMLRVQLVTTAQTTDNFPKETEDTSVLPSTETGRIGSERSPGKAAENVRGTGDGETGATYMILLNASLSPLSATVQTLKAQFWCIAVILLCGAIFLAVLISRNISRPIERMNAAAKRLAKGKYDADFSVTGFREVMELSDSLTNAAHELSRTDELQKELLANISHDLRTPLTMIVGYSEVMRDLPGENTPENVQVIIDETQRLTALVNDLLDLSKLQAGTRKPQRERFDLTEVIGSVMARYSKLTERDGYRIEVSVDRHVDVLADRTMILQVIYNLINNAINYTGEDKLVRVTQQVLGDSGRVRISVTDHGNGIPPEEIPLIWDRYYKVDKVHRRATVGTGLGLSIVKQILEEHGTTYGVESKVGEGSTFWFEMKIES